MSRIIKKIRDELKSNADEQAQNSGQRYFKERIELYGIKTAIVKKIGKENFKEVEGRNKDEIFGLCEELWKSGFIEESFIACQWSYYLRQHYETGDFAVFQKWVKEYVSNWASCDSLCNHTVGTFIEMYPEYLSDLKNWGKSSNRWMRRASAVSLIIPARKGIFLNEIFDVADILLLDEEDIVQKGYGWMLKSASEAHREEVFNYVLAHKKNMPRTALRYAIEKMPKKLKEKAMKK